MQETDDVPRATPAQGLAVTTVTMPATEQEGDRVGRYKLLQKIGEGGFGIVYLAEQEEPVRRKVALKVIKLGMDTKQVVARFEAERQALALMDHPSIAKVFDAGATDAGRPFFVMELVRGEKITDYCEKHRLSTRERLELFIRVCQAVQHAHQKGIIHRDLKPSNILVALSDGVAVPKVIDFGIAKATGGRLTDQTLFTGLEQVLGTPAYMSPEQTVVMSLDIDTRSDIYSLGVLLYELLTGTTPFDTKELLQSGLEEMRKVIREREPVRPSTRLRQTASPKVSRSGLSTLSAQLSTDLDWIVMKCLEKERARRYETANGLARDIERHLNNEPVVARPAGKLYRLRKLAQRNKVVFAAAGAVATALVAGLCMSTVMFWREQEARHEAARQKDEAKRNEQQAVIARTKAEQERERARSLSYASDMNVAWRALNENNLAEVMSLLKAQIPSAGERDLRGWEWRYFWQACQGDQLWSLGPMQNAVLGLGLLPGGRLATGVSGQDAEMRVWDIERRQILSRVALRPDNLSGLAVSPDGRFVAVATWGTNVRLFDSVSLKSIGEIKHTKPIWKVAFSPDGQFLSAQGSEDMSVWEVATTKCLWATNTPWGSQSTGAFLADGQRLACQMRDGALGLFKAKDGVLIRQVRIFTDILSSPLVNSPDGKWLAAGGWDGTLVLSDSELEAPRQLNSHLAAIHGIAFSPDSRQLATAGSDRLVKIWDVQTGRVTATFRGHRKGIMSLIYSDDGQRLYTGAMDGLVCAWAARQKASLPIAASPVPGWMEALSRDGRFLAVSETNGICHLVSSETLQETGSASTIAEHDCLAIGPDGRQLATGHHDGTVRVWNLSAAEGSWNFQAHTNQVDALAFSPDGNLLVTAGRGTQLRVWDLKSHQTVFERNVGGVGYHVNDLLFAPDSAALVLPAYGKLHFIGLRPDKPDRAAEIEEAFSVDMSRDGALVAIGLDEEARVFETPSLRQVAVFRGSLGTFNCVSFSPDHQRLIGTDSLDVTWLWDLSTGREVGRFVPKPGTGGKTHARFQPNGDTIAVARFFNGLEQLRLLRAPSWEEIRSASQ